MSPLNNFTRKFSFLLSFIVQLKAQNLIKKPRGILLERYTYKQSLNIDKLIRDYKKKSNILPEIYKEYKKAFNLQNLEDVAIPYKASLKFSKKYKNTFNLANIKGGSFEEEYKIDFESKTKFSRKSKKDCSLDEALEYIEEMKHLEYLQKNYNEFRDNYYIKLTNVIFYIIKSIENFDHIKKSSDVFTYLLKFIVTTIINLKKCKLCGLGVWFQFTNIRDEFILFLLGDRFSRKEALKITGIFQKPTLNIIRLIKATGYNEDVIEKFL